ncbi:polysaccharide deacetylase family protein [Streptomyces sp. NPDC058001]|uniref:polysaccharide deacetylase family protein n=1 Tax=Streptomyces sp. NPDC058001 TaxID=3346300 RepID=UPI0036EC2C24
MQLVGQKEQVTVGAGRARSRTRTRVVCAALLAVAVAAVASGCGDTEAGEAAGADKVKGVSGQQRPLTKEEAAAKQRAEQTARAAAAKRWGLDKTPLPAPPPPAKKPQITPRAGFEVEDQDELPPVFTTIPTKDKIVFLTIDDGADKDPALLRMMDDLKIPYTAFLSNYLAKEDYGYFRKMRDQGVTLNNHTLTHPYLPGLDYDQQKREICGMQDVMRKEFGKRPEVFRPPYGNYNQDTLRAAKSCGIKAVPLWNEEVFVDHWEYREWDQKLRPGDIVLTHFRGKNDWKGTMPDDIRQFMKLITDKGYAVAKLEDYL